ncbi:hypothetical protein QWY31_03765 [Cytophagales bacterium LB-30]|uniref:DUF3150 domain-containing protein n=1 Tax=Shiella aurantiaca TaxID=3058365 RepID=A0ABT8F2J6_9BACT|nr:hypothetical protein [Shiella aurantiaca]MDN4164603.1 hypothetical protein [Shiella aurantiaca]
MESKLNHEAIEAYASTYSKRIIADFFIQHDKITGQQIVDLKGVKQVNLMVLKNLFQKWKKESDKWQSPYFNYENPEVKKALQAFMNTLSQHISVPKNHFEPLLKRAVEDTLLLIFSPYQFYSREINHVERTRLSIYDLKDTQRYIKVNKQLLEAFIKEFEQGEVKEMFNDEAFGVFNEVCEKLKATPEDFEPFLKQFNEVAKLSIEMIYFDCETDFEAEDYKKLNKPPLKETIAEAVAEQREVTQAPLHESLVANSKEGKNLLNTLEQKVVTGSIKKNISINQRFMFVKELFGGNNDAFNQAIDALDNLPSLQAAREYLNANCGASSWDTESEEVTEFMDLLEKKFA